MTARPPSAPLTLPGVVRANAVRRGATKVVVTADRSLGHRELDERSAALAARLVAAGVGRGSRVGLQARNGVDWVVVAVATMRIGAVLVPLSTLLRPPELGAQLRVAAVDHLVVDGPFRGRSFVDDLEVAAPGVVARTAAGDRHDQLPALRRVWRLGDLPQTPADEATAAGLEDAVRPDDDLVVLFTSGSRGVPKGTIHTHDSALHAVASGLEARSLGPDDRLYIPMPFFWTGGFAMGLLSVLLAGATLVTEAVPEPAATLDLLERERVTLFRGWPDQASALAADARFAAADLSSLRDGSLAAVLPPERRPRPGSRPSVFGMTETCGTYAADRLDVDLPEEAWGSCGRPVAGIELQVREPGGRRVLDPDEFGELWLRGRNLMRGVCGRPDAEVFDGDGWYGTGDLGRLDRAGYLWFEGRADDMFKVRGATVYPAEVEGALRALDGVREAHVTDVADADGAPSVGALVVTTLELDELRAEVRERLSAFKVPTVWRVTATAADVPRTATAKVDKAALQDLLRRDGQRSDRGVTTGEGTPR